MGRQQFGDRQTMLGRAARPACHTGTRQFKAMILLKRKEGMTKAQFATWLKDQHLPMALKLPGIQHYRANLLGNCFFGGSTDPSEEYDGCSELWFENKEAFIAAYASDIGKQVAADSLANVSRRDR